MAYTLHVLHEYSHRGCTLLVGVPLHSWTRCPRCGSCPVKGTLRHVMALEHLMAVEHWSPSVCDGRPEGTMQYTLHRLWWDGTLGVASHFAPHAPTLFLLPCMSFHLPSLPHALSLCLFYDCVLLKLLLYTSPPLFPHPSRLAHAFPMPMPCLCHAYAMPCQPSRPWPSPRGPEAS